ncbi:PepSY domain-containing protein [Gluconacetobacter diazotrophicus]|uniref:PepSY domain-containing protein n=1 Tax=Gluconacetobacter diazotrophicus TaxID=33996 RepID=A0A7W4FDP5_GLUDI|nr:PepSY-associated TM helix domain-containing protein [Gluconacetobacter diazotrophicus]MBB2155752.1 PepSY domain-containing protein [Gluconacetobacter diazotrophicus]
MLRKIHRWIGLILALPLALQGITGTLLILIPLLTSGRPQTHATGIPRPMEAQIAAARPAAPAGTIPLRVSPPRWAGDSTCVSFGPPGERHPAFQVMVDPATATITGTHTIPASFFFLHRLHADLFLVPYGETATGIMGLLLLGMAITGIILWWPRPDLWLSGKWRRTITISRRARGYRFWRETHQSFGFWTALMLAFLASSGTILALPFARTVLGVHRPAPAAAHHAHGGARMPGSGGGAPGEAGLDHMLDRLRATMPDAVPMDVTLGRGPEAQQVQVALPAYGPNRPATLRLDAASDTLVMVRDPGAQKTGEVFFQWMHTLHEAKLAPSSWFAPLWRAAIFVTGLALAFFCISGAAMWALRRPARQVRDRQPIAAAPPSEEYQ